MVARSMIALIAALAAAALAVGCGGGGSSTLSKAEFAKQGNAACSKEREGTVEEVTAYLEQHSSEGTSPPVIYAGMVKAVLLPAIESELEALEALDPPEAQAKSVAKFTEMERAEIEEVKGLDHVASVEAVEAHFIPSAKLARANGISNCANGPEPVS